MTSGIVTDDNAAIQNYPGDCVEEAMRASYVELTATVYEPKLSLTLQQLETKLNHLKKMQTIMQKLSAYQKTLTSE